MLAHLGAMLAYLGAMWGQLAAQVGPSGGYVGPACARFGAYVGSKKMAKPQNTVNRGMFVGSAPSGAASTAGAGAPLSYGKKKECTAAGPSGPLAGFKGLPPTSADPC